MGVWVLALSTFAASVETDHPWYLAGEAMKVSVTADNALYAYAEVCDTYGLVASAVISLNGNKGTGTIELPSSLHSGYYLLSVYTRDNANVSQQLVAVVNPLRKSVDDDIEWVKLADSESESFATTDVSPNTFLLPPNPSIYVRRKDMSSRRVLRMSMTVILSRPSTSALP